MHFRPAAAFLLICLTACTGATETPVSTAAPLPLPAADHSTFSEWGLRAPLLAWTTLPDLPTPRNHLAAVAVGGVCT